MISIKKNSKIIYPLIVLVVALWVTILFKIFSFDNPISPDIMQAGKKHEVEKTTKENKDFELILDYKDPFLFGVNSNEKGYNNERIENPNNSNSTDFQLWQDIAVENRYNMEDNNQTEMPEVNYLGIFNNTTQGKKVAILEIDKTSYIMEEGHEKHGVKIITVKSDSIVLLVNQTQLVYKKKI